MVRVKTVAKNNKSSNTANIHILAPRLSLPHSSEDYNVFIEVSADRVVYITLELIAIHTKKHTHVNYAYMLSDFRQSARRGNERELNKHRKTRENTFQK